MNADVQCSLEPAPVIGGEGLRIHRVNGLQSGQTNTTIHACQDTATSEKYVSDMIVTFTNKLVMCSYSTEMASKLV